MWRIFMYNIMISRDSLLIMLIMATQDAGIEHRCRTPCPSSSVIGVGHSPASSAASRSAPPLVDRDRLPDASSRRGPARRAVALSALSAGCRAGP